MYALRRSLYVAIVALLTLAGCGGGGGGAGPAAPPAGPGLLNGTHFFWLYGGLAGATDRGSSGWAVAMADGVSALSGMSGGNTAGTVSGPDAFSGTYAIAGTRETAFLFSGTEYQGWTEQSGSVVIASSASLGAVPASLGMLKLGSGFTDASLQGNWFVAAFVVDSMGGAASYWGTAAFDALGGGTASLTGNIEGALIPPNAPLLTASVASNGQVALDVDGTNLEGAIDASGDLAVFTGSTTDTEFPILMVYVRKTSGASNATVSGNYQIVGLERDGSGFAAITGAVVSNGAGSLTATFTKNLDGVISTPGPTVIAYAAAADGGLTVDLAGEPLTGGFSGGGRFAVIAGPGVAMTNPRAYILMRR